VIPTYRPVTKTPTTGAGQAGYTKPDLKKTTTQPLTGLKSFKKPESTVEEQEIKIPQFFQKNR
jgi:hypothetical protein